MRVLVTGGSGFIGRHAIATLTAAGHEVVNLDIAEPAADGPEATWLSASILDRRGILRAFADFEPQHVVHLAAYATMDAKSLEELRANTVGTANLLAAVQQAPSVERLIVTSTQHVRRPGSGPASSSTDFAPLAYYGESKVVTEQLTREAPLDCVWTIIRPTAVWGPHHRLLADGLWRLMSRGRYIHPARDPVVRSYGYVGNVACQIAGLLRADADRVAGEVFYVADANMRQLDWVNAFARALQGRDVRTVPLPVIRGLSRVGDVLRAAGLPFPMYEDRLQNLITSNPVPIEPTLELLGQPPIGLQDGVGETVAWLREYYGSAE